MDYKNEAGTTVRIVKQDQTAINNSISSKMNSSIAGDKVEAKVGDYIQSSTDLKLTDYANKVKTPGGGTLGDIDCATSNTLIEIKKSASSIKGEQFDKYIDQANAKYINVENKQVVLYVEEPINYNNIKNAKMIEKLKTRGVIVVNSLEELEGVLK